MSKGNGKMEYASNSMFMGVNNGNSIIGGDGIIKMDMALKAESVRKKVEEGLKIKQETEGWELKPLNSYVLFEPLKDNPFNQTTVTESGIILPEIKKEVKSDETGQILEMDCMTKVGRVISVSGVCKNEDVHPGDYIYYRINSAVPVPHYRCGYEVVAETSILAVLTPNKKE